MKWLYSILIGLFIVFIAVIFIKKEFSRINFFKNVKFNTQEKTEIFNELKKLDLKIDDLNHSYYEILNEVEGNYSIREKDINDLKLKVSALEKYILNESNNNIINKDEEKISEIKNELNDEIVSLNEEIERLRLLGYDDKMIAKKLNISLREISLRRKI